MIRKGKLIKAFISYKWEDFSHNKWVEDFAAHLRKVGVDAMLDIWEVKYGESFTDYMTSAISTADVVLFIMTPTSVEAVEAPKDKGGAVKFEVQLSTARRIAGEGFRFIGILRRGDKIAAHLRDFRWVDFRNDEQYVKQLQALVDDLFEIDKKPSLGKAVTYESGEVFRRKCTIGKEFSRVLLKARFVPNSKDIVVWSSFKNEPVESLRLYKYNGRKYEVKDALSSRSPDEILFDKEDRIAMLDNQDALRILDRDLHELYSIGIGTVGEPTMRSVVFSEEAPLVAIGTDYGSVLLWNYELDTVLWNKRFFPRSDIQWINKLAFKDDANEILFLAKGYLFRVDVSSGKIKRTSRIDKFKHGVSFAFSNKNSLLAVADPTTLSAYDFSGTRAHLYDFMLDYSYPDYIEFDKSGNLLTIVSGTPMSYRSVNIIDAKRGNVLFTLDSRDIIRGNIESCSLSDDSRFLAISRSKEIVVYQRVPNINKGLRNFRR